MPWNLARAGRPWAEGRLSLYAFILGEMDEKWSLGKHPPDLPDTIRDPNTISFAPGALDGISRNFGVAESEPATVESITEGVARLSRRSNRRNARRLYEQLLDAEVLSHVDAVVESLTSRDLDAGRIRSIGRWLARSAPDRSPVKFGMALLGVVPLPIRRRCSSSAHTMTSRCTPSSG